MSEKRQDETPESDEIVHPLEMSDRDLAAILPNKADAFRRGYSMGAAETKQRVRMALLRIAATLEREVEQDAAHVAGEPEPPLH